METMQTPYTKPDRYIRCPSCGEGESRIDHLAVGSTAGPWHCDNCGAQYRLEIISETIVKVEATGEKTIATDVHLVLDDVRQLPLRLIVEGMAFGKMGQSDEEIIADKDNGDRYFYEEHTCVSNFLKSVKKVIAADGDEDRHGIFRWEQTVPKSVDAETVDARPLLEAGRG